MIFKTKEFSINYSWTLSKATKDGVDSDIAKYNGKWQIAKSTENALPDDLGLLLQEKAKYVVLFYQCFDLLFKKLCVKKLKDNS